MESSKKNKFKSDLKYVIIAIVLIIFGVLFALQVFNWNAERKKVAKENELQNALIIDLINAETKSIELV